MSAHGVSRRVSVGGPRITRALAAGAFAITASIAAVFAAPRIAAYPQAALGLPVMVASTFVAGRRPALVVGAMFLLTGTFGSLTAFTSIPVGVTVDVLLGGLVAGVALAWLLASRPRPHLWPGLALVLLYVLGTLLWVGAAADMALELQAFRASAWLLLAVPVIALAPWGAEVREAIVHAVILIAIGVGAYAVLRWAIGPSAKEAALALQNARLEANKVDGQLRVVGSFAGGKQLAAWCAMTIPFCLAAALAMRSLWRLLAGAAVVLCAIGLFAPSARAAFVAVLAACLVVLVLYQLARAFQGLHLEATAAAVAAAVLIGGGAFALTTGNDESKQDRFASVVDPQSDNAFVQRQRKWSIALSEADDHPLGSGLSSAGRTQKEKGRFRTLASLNFDSSYLTLATQQGLAVMVLYVIALLAVLAGLAQRAVRTTDVQAAALGMGAAGTLTAMLVLFVFADYYEGLPALAGWILVGTGAGALAYRPARARPTVVAASPVAEAPVREPAPATPPPEPAVPAPEPDPARVVIVMNLPELSGGAEQVLLEFMRHVDRRVIEPIVVFFGQGSLERAVAELDVETVVVPPARLRQVRRSGATVRRLRGVLESTRPDLIVSWLSKAHLYAAPAARGAGMGDRLVRLQNDFAGRGGVSDRVIARLPARTVIACSDAVAEAEQAMRAHSRVVTVYPGIDQPPVPDQARLDRMRSDLGIDGSLPVVGIVGRLLPWKGQDRFIEAIGILRERGHRVRALVVGGNAYDLAPRFEQQLRDRARELGIADDVVFSGQVERGSDYLPLLDVFVSASTPEPFGIVLLEAMAARVPVVAVAAGGPAEIVEDGVSGVLAPNGHPAHLADAIERLLDAPALRDAVTVTAFNRFSREFSAERMTADLQRVLLEAVAAR